ncbi:hypothetical protein E6O75_ATG11412 [Venturia nashicola]|uniref:Uncharacterized protein n=1 Tax=Venturia nashicola TaxID=86259 RepID=A0A4Z1NDS2_9PEZI|nr:hypothetical protein E6O75_ATG11412 [Venturia nashicola]
MGDTCDDPHTLPHRSLDLSNPITVARWHLLGPRRFYEDCDDIEPNPRIGWGTTTDGPPYMVEGILNSTYLRIQDLNYDYNVLDLDFWSSSKLRPRIKKFGQGWKVLQFISLIRRNGAALCLAVRLTISENQVVDVSFKLGSGWMEFTDFLNLLVLAAPTDPAKIRHIWKQSGKKFNLLALPRELRDQVWAYAVFFDKQCLVGAPGGRRGPRFEGVMSYRGSFHSVPLTDATMPRQIREEARLVLWTQGTFQFKSIVQFSDFFLHAKAEDLVMLRKMELNFGYEDWLRLLGAQLTSRARFTACRSVDVLQTAPLKELKLVFRKPSDLYRTDYRIWDYQKGCHTKVLQWILNLFTPILGRASIKTLKVEGFIKHAQKAHFYKEIEEFKEMLKDPKMTLEELKEEGDEGGGVSLLGAREQAILALPDFQVENEMVSDDYDPEELYPRTQLPPICLCKHQCTLDADEFLKHLNDDDLSVLGY